MGTLTSFFGGGGGGSAAPLPVYTFLNSVTGWTPPYDGTAYIHVIGAGGNGRTTDPSGGGGAGGYCRKLITLTTLDSYNITVGSASTISGGSGTASIFTNSSSITLTANGGTGSPGSSGGDGGTASGGDVNYTGGNGGLVNGTSGQRVAGGGAVNLTGTAYAGGTSYSFTSSSYSSSGGAGIGGEGGTTYPRYNSVIQMGGGGGSAGRGIPSVDLDEASQGIASIGGPAAGGKPYGIIGFDFIKEWGAGGSMRFKSNSANGTYTVFSEVPAGIGGGGSGGLQRDYVIRGQDGGLFGGGGAYGGNGGLGGGGGGGGTFFTNGDAVITRGQGGNGVIYVEYVTLA